LLLHSLLHQLQSLARYGRTIQDLLYGQVGTRGDQILVSKARPFGKLRAGSGATCSKLPFQVTIDVVEITFDPQKHERNLRERNLGFDEAAQFDFLSASYFGEVRNGEDRVVGIGYLGKRLHVLCFIPTHNGIRVISFRKANDREARKYGKPKTIDE
jgi:uncharacterized DUF497 family protein